MFIYLTNHMHTDIHTHMHTVYVYTHDIHAYTYLHMIGHMALDPPDNLTAASQ
jgi:hypothetical protein